MFKLVDTYAMNVAFFCWEEFLYLIILAALGKVLFTFCKKQKTRLTKVELLAEQESNFLKLLVGAKNFEHQFKRQKIFEKV